MKTCTLKHAFIALAISGAISGLVYFEVLKSNQISTYVTSVSTLIQRKVMGTSLRSDGVGVAGSLHPEDPQEKPNITQEHTVNTDRAPTHMPSSKTAEGATQNTSSKMAEGVEAGEAIPGGARKKNILFIVVDDLRPQINAWEGPNFPDPTHPKMHTPYMDDLATRSLVLERAYCQYALCGPSRASFFTSRRPDTTRIYDLSHFFHKFGDKFTTIPEYFSQHGYYAMGTGKLLPGHGYMWQSPPGADIRQTGPSTKNHRYFGKGKKGPTWASFSEEEMQNATLWDQVKSITAINWLRKLAPKALTGEQPFFMGVGYMRPHLPWYLPQKYFDMYSMSDMETAPNKAIPKDDPPIAWWGNWEFKPYGDIQNLNNSLPFKRGTRPNSENQGLPDGQALLMRRAYFASVSYVDELIGDVLKELDRLGLRNSTIVSLIGDHGYMLGEHSQWGKHSNFDAAQHVPMMMSIPGVTDSGVRSDALTELVDVYPTLVQAAGLPPLAQCPGDSAESRRVPTCTEGLSFLPLTDQPKRAWKQGAFAQYLNHDHMLMGYSIKTDEYHYSNWVGNSTSEFRQRPFDFNSNPQKPKPYPHKETQTLYNHRTDPQENFNLAYKQEYASVVRELQIKLDNGWSAAMPA